MITVLLVRTFVLMIRTIKERYVFVSRTNVENGNSGQKRKKIDRYTQIG